MPARRICSGGLQLTWPMFSWTEALSLAWMRRLVAELRRTRGQPSPSVGAGRRGQLLFQAADTRAAEGVAAAAPAHAPLARDVQVDVLALRVVHARSGARHG